MTIDPTDYELNVIVESEQGPPGPRGIDANTIWSGSGPPTNNVGVIGDWYINKDTHYIFGPKDVTGWPTGVSVIGPQGATGQMGPGGERIYNGTGEPDNLTGVAGDWYIQAQTDVWRLWGPKSSDDRWDPFDYVSLIGPAGGRTILYGSGAPGGGTGIDGDFYIRTDDWSIYGPKETTWPSPVSLVGPQGPQGETGETGAAGTFTISALSAAADFDACTTTGLYYSADTSSTNAPVASKRWYLEVLRSSATEIAQRAICLDDTASVYAAVYNRTMVAGTWGAWRPVLFASGASQNIAQGYTATSHALGNMTNFTVDPTLGNMQHGTNHGAVTITAPTVDCSVDIKITNDASAGAISFSGFTVASGNTGDNFTTTNGHKFILSILRIDGTSTFMVKALQ